MLPTTTSNLIGSTIHLVTYESCPSKSDKNGHKWAQNMNIVAQMGTVLGTGVAQKKGRKTEAQRTAGLTDSLPAGITIGQWPDGRRKPFFVRHGPRDARVLESFAIEQDRNDAAEKLAQGKEEEGSSILGFDPKEWREYMAFRQRCPAPLHELESLWKQTVKQVMLVSEAAPRYLKLRVSEDINEHSDTYRHMELHMERLVSAYGALRLDQVTPDLIRELLGKLKARNRKDDASKTTKRDHRKNWNTLFQRAVDEEWCARNPCSKVKPPKILAQEKVPLTPREIFDLLSANRDEPVIGRIALELFGGLRAASAERLRLEHLKFSAKGIRMPGTVKDAETGEIVNNHKSTTTKYRQGHPVVLWDWLEHAPNTCWTEIDENNYAVEKAAAFRRAKVKNPGNILRDSFCSYHLAWLKNRQLTSYLMQHKRMAQTETYEGVAEEDDAKLVMAMEPKQVAMGWDRFRALFENA